MTSAYSVDALVQVLVQADKLVKQKPACSIVVVVITPVVGEVVGHWGYRQLLSEDIDL